MWWPPLDVCTVEPVLHRAPFAFCDVAASGSHGVCALADVLGRWRHPCRGLRESAYRSGRLPLSDQRARRWQAQVCAKIVPLEMSSESSIKQLLFLTACPSFFTHQRMHAHHLRCCKHRWRGERRHAAQLAGAGLLARLTGFAVRDGGRARWSGSRRCAAVPALQRDGGRRRQLRHCRLLQPPRAALFGVQLPQLHHLRVRVPPSYRWAILRLLLWTRRMTLGTVLPKEMRTKMRSTKLDTHWQRSDVEKHFFNPRSGTLYIFWWTIVRTSMCALHETTNGSPSIPAEIPTWYRRVDTNWNTVVSRQYRWDFVMDAKSGSHFKFATSTDPSWVMRHVHHKWWHFVARRSWRGHGRQSSKPLRVGMLDQTEKRVGTSANWRFQRKWNCWISTSNRCRDSDECTVPGSTCSKSRRRIHRTRDSSASIATRTTRA